MRFLDQTSTSTNHDAFFIFLTRRFVGETHTQYYIDSLSLSSNKSIQSYFIQILSFPNLKADIKKYYDKKQSCFHLF
jgi:hypothetical protein